ncbi:MAG: glucosaminidase domain-containing protein [Thermodesulfobacteriota bacterium]
MKLQQKHIVSDGLLSPAMVSRISRGAAPVVGDQTRLEAKNSLASTIIRASSIIAGCALLSLIALLLFRLTSADSIEKPVPSIAPAAEVTGFKVDSADELLATLQGSNLWEIDKEVPAVVFANLPADLEQLDVPTKKKAFLNTLLPIGLIAVAEVAQEKKMLTEILAKLEHNGDTLLFDEETVWPQGVTDEEIDILEHLCRKYRTTSKQMLVNRVDVVPVSLILAQGALESSWGGSRFCREGNNLFGVWTWGEEGMLPREREEGESHKVAIYESLLESVRAYLLMLNRLPAYADFRDLRKTGSVSSLDLADGLLYYSERRDSYVDDLKKLIVANGLQKFDGMELSADFQPALPPETIKLVLLDAAKNASL